MTEYKCISCGEIRESAEACSCPVCGYKMFETPYDRAEILRKEIRDFAARLRLGEVSDKSFVFFRKALNRKESVADEDEFEIIYKKEDDKRFPDFAKIQGYVCSSTKTEMFYERLNNAIEQIKKHIHESYAQEYQISADGLTEEIEGLDEVLKEVLPELGISLELPAIDMPELKLKYTETPNGELLGIAEAILDNLALLSEKIKKFIKQNNIYGTAYQKKPKSACKPSEEPDYAGDLHRCGSRVSTVLAKKYTVDIFSDGSDELGEMLKALWGAIDTILTIPVLVKKYVYLFPDGTTAVNDGIYGKLLKHINSRYSALDEAIYAYDFLTERSVDELF